MIIIVDERLGVTQAYSASFEREGISTTGFNHTEFEEWLEVAGMQDLAAVEAVIIGSFPTRERMINLIKSRSNTSVIAINETLDLESMLDFFNFGADDVVRKPVHARELIARIGAIKRRISVAPRQSDFGKLKIYYDGRDPEVNGQPLILPRRERRILEYLVANRMRRVNRSLIFNAVYGLFDEEFEESVVESHICKLRKKLKRALGYDPIDSRRYLGYQLVNRNEQQSVFVVQSSLNKKNVSCEPFATDRAANIEDSIPPIVLEVAA